MSKPVLVVVDRLGSLFESILSNFLIFTLPCTSTPLFRTDKKGHLALATVSLSILLFGTFHGAYIAYFAFFVAFGYLTVYTIFYLGFQFSLNMRQHVGYLIPLFLILVFIIGFFYGFVHEIPPYLLSIFAFLFGIAFLCFFNKDKALIWPVTALLTTLIGIFTLIYWMATSGRFPVEADCIRYAVRQCLPYGPTEQFLPTVETWQGYWTAIFVISTVGVIFFFLLAHVVEKCRLRGSDISPLVQEARKAIVQELEVPAILLSLIALIILVLVFLVPVSKNSIAVSIMLLTGVTLIGFSFYPLKLMEPGLYYAYTNRKHKFFAWNGNKIAGVLASIFVWAILTLIAINLNHAHSVYILLFVHLIVTIGTLWLAGRVLGAKAASFFLNFISGQPDIEAEQAAVKYHRIANEANGRICGHYYGRVCIHDRWVILQYHYFYAYNDYRRIARGLNNHQGDWETIAIYFKPPSTSVDSIQTCKDFLSLYREPFGVAFSQHHFGGFAFWDDVRKVKDKTGQELCHPLVYVALGSHANYALPKEYTASEHFTGQIKKLVAWFDQIFRQSDRHLALDQPSLNLTADDFPSDITKQLSYEKIQSGLPLEYATGDGLRIGCSTETTDFSDEYKISRNLPLRETKRESTLGNCAATKGEFANLRWVCHSLDEQPEPGWLEFKGRWGRWVRLADESGPPGPKWDRHGNERLRWGSSKGGLEWLETLLFNSLDEAQREKALQKLIEG
ncbi:MAG: hypothetical protein H6668_16985 [Ardenticatenaceae bacterium]|nr:hypothetical protein [Ardenticatenaceae bacterium]